MAWVTHPKYTSYQIGNGKIRNKKTKRVLKPKIRWDGYEEVSLMHEGKKVSVKVHRAAAEAKKKRTLSKKEVVDHKDGSRTSNKSGNLRVTTSSENNKSKNKNKSGKKYQNSSKKRTYSSRKK